MADLNRSGRSYARSLINSGRVDKTSAWSFSADDGNKLLGADGSDWANYGKHHLGVDPNENFDTKDHWKYPFAKEGTLYRSGLVAVRQRAGQQKDKTIFESAGALLDEIDGSSDRTHEAKITVTTRPPKIELDIQPRADMAAAPPSADVLDKWNAGLRLAAAEDGGNVIQIMDVIGYDFWSGGGITADSISAQLKAIGKNPVEVQINSPGGDMFEGIAIYEAFRQHPAPVTMKVMGIAASAASIIAMAGDKREISQAGFLMIHNCWILAMGNRNDLREAADYLEPFDQALCSVYVAVTGQKKSDVATWMDNETYLNANDAIRLGFAQSVIGRAAITEDAAATERARQFNSVRKVEALLTRKGGMTRAAARAVIQELKSGKPGAAANTTQDAGDEWSVVLKAAIDGLNKN